MIIGHDSTIKFLKKLAIGDKLSSGYIFFGPSMIGKRLVAEYFANYLENGEFGPAKILTDCAVLAPDLKGTIGIDEARNVKKFLWQKPVKSRRRVIIIDDAERLTAEAQNALLKIAEEPPASSLIILVTSNQEGIFETLRSRLQRVYFSIPGEGLVCAWLREDLKFKKDEAEKLAKSSFGKPGLALALKNNEVLAEHLGEAGKLFNTKSEARKAFIKEIISPDDFILNDFLDAIILYSASQKNYSPPFWHKLLELRDRNENFALNPKLQLENLFL